MQQQPDPAKPDVDKSPEQSEIARGTPPPRVPGGPTDTDLEPEQQPVRDTPDVTGPGAASQAGIVQSHPEEEPGADPSNQPASPLHPKPGPMPGTPPDVEPGIGASPAEEHPLGASEPMPPDPQREKK